MHRLLGRHGNAEARTESFVMYSLNGDHVRSERILPSANSDLAKMPHKKIDPFANIFVSIYHNVSVQGLPNNEQGDKNPE
jgi:hypothetical protein